MWTDPIVEEVHAIRKTLLEQAGGDLHQAILMAHLARNPKRRIFQGQPRRPVGWVLEPNDHPLANEALGSELAPHKSHAS
jgi:hypothetical protein